MSKPKQVGDIVNELDKLVASVGMGKLAEKRAGIIADPGTSQPAEQKADRSNIQPATKGAHGAENSSMVKNDVSGQSVDEGNPSDAKKKPAAKSATDNITTATTVGEDPSVEKGYGSADTAGNYPGTTHPADPNKQDDNTVGKSASDLQKSADFVLAEIEQRGTLSKVASTDDLTMENAIEKFGSLLVASEEGEKTAEEKAEVVKTALMDFINGYTKSAGLVGELTADYLDGLQAGLQKRAEEEEEGAAHELAEMPAEEGAEDAADAGGEAMMGAAGGAGDAQTAAAADAILAEATAIADALGVEPEDVLEAALASEGGMEGGGEMITPEELEASMGSVPPMEVAANFRKMAMHKIEKKATEKLASLKAKFSKHAKKDDKAELPKDVQEKLAAAEAVAKELKEIKEAQEKSAVQKASDEHIESVVTNAMNKWWVAKEAEVGSKAQQ